MATVSHTPKDKIGLLIYALNRKPQGIGQYTLRLLDAFKMIGFGSLILQSGGWPEGREHKDYQVVNLRGAGLLPALLTLGQLEIGFQAMKRGLKLVHDPTGTAPLSGCNAKKVITICDTIPFIFPKVSSTLEYVVYHFWLPLAIKQVDSVLTISEQSKMDIEKYLKVPGEKITVTKLAAGPRYHQLDPAEIEVMLKRLRLEQPYILYIGSIEPRKNLLRLLEAYQKLCEWSGRWRLVIVGARSYWKSSPVAEKVEKLGLKDKVIFTGYVRDEDLPALYNGADLFCFPSLYEGFGLPVLEAMACGVPVVTSNTSSLPEVAGEAAILVDPYNVTDMAAAMRRILEDRELAGELREKGLARAAQFSWEKTARETIAVYEKVLGENLI